MATQYQQVPAQPQSASSYQVGAQPYPQPQSVAVQPAPLAPGAVTYYQQQPGQAFMSTPSVNYKPNDFFNLTVLTIAICGVCSPITLVCSIPALLFSLKSRESIRTGDIKGGRNNGMVAVYLNITAIVLALVVACLATGLTIGLYYTANCRYVDYRRVC